MGASQHPQGPGWGNTNDVTVTVMLMISYWPAFNFDFDRFLKAGWRYDTVAVPIRDNVALVGTDIKCDTRREGCTYIYIYKNHAITWPVINIKGIVLNGT